VSTRSSPARPRADRLDASRWYFWQGAFVVALVLGLALRGFRNVLGKQTLLPAGAVEE
jgi:hypothetical protein